MSGLIKLFFFLGDLLFLNLSLLISFSIWNQEIGKSEKIYLLIFSNLAWLFLIMVSNPYNLNKGWSLSKIIRSQLAFIFIHLLVVASLVSFFNKDYPLVSIGFIYLIFIVFFFMWKIFVYYLRKVFTPEINSINYILIGRNETSIEIRKFYLLNPQLGYSFKGYLELGKTDELIDRIRSFSALNEVHEIYCCAPQMNNESLKPLINFGLDTLIKVKVIAETGLNKEPTLQFDKYDKEPGLSLIIIPLDESRNQIIKRIFDLAFSFTFLVMVMSWLLPIIALFIVLDSKGPVFFIQFRSGLNNKPFYCFKFRTMKVNKEADSIQASKDDPRITKLGAFLRRTSIDELPQFINVFIGNMSVVGPRPHMLKHTEEYAKLIDTFMGRHYIKPGITGLAQCMGYRGETKDLSDMENRVRLDRYYIENWTFWLDIKIIFLTVVSLIRGSDKAF